ncbi:peptidoglycan-binding domain-containing protein [Streptomyces sp. BE133]|uniref:peptidoglycan-binding domain-containing protein n=1 Tax=Streptomyces sp. BE133 TaxID=3002523 RepID=UPI002E76AD7E|nr:peptidoglycan-binding domain-containing protein [Streptomyces sp. BE133]MEE1812196.1 peptidoglycan-binding domain-containing protein [Streptomyces sp. BE133]
MRTRRSKHADRGGPAGIPEDVPADSALTRRRRLLAGVVMGALALAGAGFAVSTMIKSPAQAAAEAGAPERDVLTAAVEHRVLRSSLVVRGQVAAERTVTVSAAVSAAEGAEPLVTKAPLRAGDAVRAGRVLVEISGRPVFALPGALPAYRDLKPGARGDDVTQLQKALSQRGFGSSTDTAGEFGAGTQAALAAYYRSIGYDPRPVSEDGDAQVETAATAVTDATRALQDVRADKPEATEVARAEEDLARAEKALANARLQAGAMLPAAEIVFLGRFPARVESVAARVGDRAPGKVMTISSGTLGVRGVLSPSQQKMVRAGQKVRILAEATGDEFDGTATSVTESDAGSSAGGGAGTGEGEGGDGAEAGSDGAASAFSTLNVTADKKIDATLVGQEVRLTIEIKSSQGKVLVVPFSAVSAAADGSTVVTVLTENGEHRRVRVRPGLEGDGSVQVTPVPQEALAEGDRVIVGTRSAERPGQDDTL